VGEYGTNVSINLKDVLPSLLRLNDTRKLYKYNNGGTCTLPDQAYLNYSDAVNANNSPLASWNNQGNDGQLSPRGSHPLEVTLNQYTSAGVFVSTSPVCVTEGNTFVVQVSGNFIEPLFLSPFIFGHPELNCGCSAKAPTSMEAIYLYMASIDVGFTLCTVLPSFDTFLESPCWAFHLSSNNVSYL
jgi:hypothetical protein